mmetsp:Transcript_30026/g.85987  ORF Transcript_30026/g.85987 Transcript_30026/m.85987 type:complete len:223 (-) Transcript_30026:40-708(-)
MAEAQRAQQAQQFAMMPMGAAPPYGYSGPAPGMPCAYPGPFPGRTYLPSGELAPGSDPFLYPGAPPPGAAAYPGSAGPQMHTYLPSGERASGSVPYSYSAAGQLGPMSQYLPSGELAPGGSCGSSAPSPYTTLPPGHAAAPPFGTGGFVPPCGTAALYSGMPTQYGGVQTQFVPPTGMATQFVPPMGPYSGPYGAPYLAAPYPPMAYGMPVGPFAGMHAPGH